MTHRVLNKYKARSVIHTQSKSMAASDFLHDVAVYVSRSMLLLVEHSVCHEPISILINVFMFFT